MDNLQLSPLLITAGVRIQFLQGSQVLTAFGQSQNLHISRSNREEPGTCQQISCVFLPLTSLKPVFHKSRPEAGCFPQLLMQIFKELKAIPWQAQRELFSRPAEKHLMKIESWLFFKGFKISSLSTNFLLSPESKQKMENKEML